MIRKQKPLIKGSKVEVKDDFFQQLRKFNKLVKDSGLMNELRERQAYEPPSTRRKRKKNEAKQRAKREKIRNEPGKRMY